MSTRQPAASGTFSVSAHGVAQGGNTDSLFMSHRHVLEGETSPSVLFPPAGGKRNKSASVVALWPRRKSRFHGAPEAVQEKPDCMTITCRPVSHQT